MTKFLLSISLSCFLSLSTLAAVGSSMLNTALKITHPIEVVKNIPYAKASWQKLNIYPAEDMEPAPVIIFIYGGAWYKGSKEQHHFVADGLVRLGYTVVIPDYIKYPTGRFPAFIEDVALATAWVKTNIHTFGGNPELIFLVGHSAGAHTGALLVTDNSYLAAVGLSKQDIKGFAGLAGPYNFTPDAPQFIDTFGRENFKTMKANTHVDGTEPPIILMHSSGDKTVDVLNMQTFRNKLLSEGVWVATRLFEDIGHVSMVLKIHPWFAGKIDLAKEVDVFFSQITKLD